MLLFLLLAQNLPTYSNQTAQAVLVAKFSEGRFFLNMQHQRVAKARAENDRTSAPTPQISIVQLIKKTGFVLSPASL